MAEARIPALAQTRVVPFTRIHRERILPTRGNVVVAMGSRVGALDIVASCAMERLRPVPLARYMRVPEAVLPKYVVKKSGDEIEAREIIASKPESFGFLRRVYRAPGAGRVTALQGSWLAMELTGAPFELKALYRGSIVNVMPHHGVVIEATGALVQGAWGAGGEGNGVLKKMVDSPGAVLTEDQIDVAARGSILIAGAGVTQATLRRAAQERVAGLIVGGLSPSLRDLIRTLEIPTLVTEGLGEQTMCTPIFDLLARRAGDEASINTAMGSRAAARPEVFIPAMASSGGDMALPSPTLVAESGATVRILTGSRLGETGKIAAVPPAPRILESGVLAWGAEIELNEGNRVFVPWDNLELIG